MVRGRAQIPKGKNWEKTLPSGDRQVPVTRCVQGRGMTTNLQGPVALLFLGKTRSIKTAGKLL